MNFPKPPLSIADQLLKMKGRGLVIDKPDEAAARLASIGYYRLSGYALAFQDALKDDKPFRAGTTWEMLIDLYVLTESCAE